VSSGATTTLTVTSSGSPHTVTANYVNADGNFSNSSGTLSGGQTVNPNASTVTLTSSPNPAAFGQSITFTATVTSGGSGTPTGTVTFKDGTTTLGTGTLNTSGVATFATYR